MGNEPVVGKVTASSGKVDYGQKVVIRGGGKTTTHLEVLPTFVPRSGKEDLCLKIAYWKTKRGQYLTGFPAEFTLTEAEILQLREVIDRNLALSGNESGQYLLIKLDDAEAVNLDGRNAAAVGKALLSLLAKPGIEESLVDLPSATQIVNGIQTSLKIRSLESGIAELESALEDGIAEESFYQGWCERNAWAFGNAYAMRDAVRNIALGDSVDLLMKRTTDQFRDIFELKRPGHAVLGYDDSHKSYYWASETSRTIGQTHRYLDALHEAAAKGLRDHPEVLAYYPYGTIVIGRSNDWDADRQQALHGLNARLHSIRVITYDHLLEQAKRALAILTEDESA